MHAQARACRLAAALILLAYSARASGRLVYVPLYSRRRCLNGAPSASGLHEGKTNEARGATIILVHRRLHAVCDFPCTRSIPCM